MPNQIVYLVVFALLGTSAGGTTPRHVDNLGDTNRPATVTEIARWLRSTAIRSKADSAAWRADPADSESIGPSLYAGTAGIVIFFIEAHHVEGDDSYLGDARAGANYLLTVLSDEEECGLYEGVAGIGFALLETYRATGEAKYREGGLRCVQLLRQRAKHVGKGVEWNDFTDVIAGGAGIGLFLLYAARELHDTTLRDFASADGQRLIELAQPQGNGSKWAMSPAFARLMPNFSHGTAGIAYFLASLYQETKSRAFLDAALAGARYLKAVAKTEDDVCLIFHDEPDNKELYYLGWCHGPVGTARLFYRLYQVTGDRAWMDWVKRSARGVLKSGIPEGRTPGFWNNVSQCCGSAGVAEFFLSLYRLTYNPEYLRFSRRVTAELLSRATRDNTGTRWVQAEHRIMPELLVAQTGYMQGAAGIGLMLLHQQEFERRSKPAVKFPDSPF